MKVIGRIVSFWGLWVALWVLAPLAAGAQTKDDLVLYDPYEFKLCNGSDGGQDLKAYNQSSDVLKSNGVFYVDWGDGNPKEAWGNQEAKTHHYDGFQVFKLVFSWESNDGTKKLSRTYDVFRLKKPSASLKTEERSVCYGSESEIQILDYDKQSPGTMYQLTFGRDGVESFSQKEVESFKGTIKHTFRTSECPIGVRFVASNECLEGVGSVDLTYNIPLIMSPVVGFDIPGPNCTGYPLNVRNHTTGGRDIMCNENITYVWEFENQPASFERNPTVVYDKPGQYHVSLTVRTGQVECSEQKKEMTIEVLETPEVDFEVANDEICSGSSLIFKNKSTGQEPLTFYWVVRKDNGVLLPNECQFINGTHIQSRNPEIQFNGYGNYYVALTVSNSCPESVKEIPITVRKNPQVYLELPEVICSDDDGNKTLNFNYGNIGYTWNGNDEEDVKAKWTIETVEGNGKVEYVDGTNANSLYPTVKLAGSATYSFKVEVEPVKVNGEACSDPSVAVAKKVRVPSTKIELAFDPAPSDEPVQACFGDTLKFTNNSVGEELICWWELEPMGEYRNSVLFKELNGRQAKLVFDYGEFDLTARMAIAGSCPVDVSETYRIQIGHRPEIVYSYLDQLGAFCPGDTLDINLYMYVNYHHHNNSDQAYWTFKPELPAEAFLNGTTSTSARPVIQFKQPNTTYHYRIEMPRDHLVPGCEDPKATYELEGDLVVRNNQLSSKISAENDEVCEGDFLNFLNEGKDPQSGGLDPSLKYEWYAIDKSGMQTGDCEFLEPVGSTDQLANVKFLHYGDYGVVGKTLSPCGVAYDTVWVTVKKDPSVKFKGEHWEVCPGEVRTGDWVTIEWFNNSSSQQVGWLLEQEGQQVWQEQTFGTDEKPAFSLKEPGDYTLSVTVPGVGCKETEVRRECVLHVIDTAIRGMETILPMGYALPRGVCVGEDLGFENGANAERDLTWHWEIVGMNGGYGFDNTGGLTSTEQKPILRFNEPGEYTVRLTIEEGCNTREWTYSLTVRGIPTLNLKDQAGCEEGFRFVGNDEIKAPALDLKNNELLGTHWDVSVEYGEGSYKWEDGGENAQYPTIAFTPVPSSGRCIYRVNVEYENHCPEPTRDTFAVRIDEKVKIEPLVNEDICELVEARRLQVAVPDSGVWELVDASLPAHVLEWRGDGYYFNPDFSAYEDKEVRLRYTIQNGACTSTDEMTMRVHALPFVDGGRDLQMCYNQEPLPLVGRDSIKGGHWQENRGIWKLGKADLENQFDITKWDAIPGDYPLTYEYTYTYDNGYQCTNMDEVVLTVQRLPEKEFAVADTLCVGVEGEFLPKELEGNAFEWCFDFLHAPTAKEESGEEGILHAYDRHGSYTVRCVASRPYPYHESVLVCRDTSEKAVTVLRNPPAVYFDVNKTEGCAPLDIHLTVDAPYYDTLTFADFTYTWDFGNGEKDVIRTFGNGELLKTYQSATWDTTYFLSLAVGNRCETFRHDTSVTVFSVPKVGMAPTQDWECSPVEAEVKNTTTGNNCKFTWTISNDRNDQIIGDLHTYNFNYHLETDSATTVYAIKLHAENICATDDSTIYIKVKPQTLEAHFSTLDDRYACEREEIYFRNNSTDTATNILVTKWMFGDGHVSEEWELSHPYDKAGVYPVVLWINNGCGWAADTQQVYIDPLPKLSIVSQDTLCEDEEFHFAFEADMDLSLFEWKLRDTLIKRDSFEYTFKGYGSFPVTFIGIAGEGTFTRCQDSVIKTVVVNNKPIMTILPLDTAICSPLDYVPFVEGEYETLLWDYGDGTEVTSESAHYYANRGDSALRYLVTAFVTTDKGCYSEFVRGVTVYNTPVAGLDKEVESGRPQRVTFLNLSEGADAVRWILPLSGEIYSEKLEDSQTESFMENGVYPVTLIASNRYGCADTITLEHEVDMHGLYFPNTFIPHSLNDKINRFNGIGMGLRSYHLEILDQYGNVLWMTEELDDGKPVGGWDGTNRKGQRMPQGIYIWRAKAIFGNDDIWTGDNNDSGIPEYTQGTVLLLRE